MVEVPDFLAGTIAVSGDFWHFSRTPAVVGSTPKVGEHNEEVLGGLLGYSEEEIARLYAKDVIGNSAPLRHASRLKPRPIPRTGDDCGQTTARDQRECPRNPADDLR